MDRHIGKIMGYAQLGVWGNIPWKFELNPFSSLGEDVFTSLDNETKTDERKNEGIKIRGVRENTASQCSKNTHWRLSKY